jgi:hypothetical protein
VFPAGPVRVTFRVQLPLAQLPDACTLDVPRGPVDVPERVQALASAAAAIDRAPIMAAVRKSFFMVVFSLMSRADNRGCRCGSREGDCRSDVSAALRTGNDWYCLVAGV